ncbi:MAG: hypothetical protein OWU33_08650 [Firmicutes bacterium]|jgi:hypothetical protein|nr:hypothetical protein [Bacillota bacterium]
MRRRVVRYARTGWLLPRMGLWIGVALVVGKLFDHRGARPDQDEP